MGIFLSFLAGINCQGIYASFFLILLQLYGGSPQVLRDRSGAALLCCTTLYGIFSFDSFNVQHGQQLLAWPFLFSLSLSVPALGIGRGVVGVISIIVDDDDVLGHSATAAAAAVSLHTSSSLPEFFWTLRKRARSWLALLSSSLTIQEP